jgi:hypothetical protein
LDATRIAVELAYRRGDALEKRYQMMEAWAKHCETREAGKVVELRKYTG